MITRRRTAIAAMLAFGLFACSGCKSDTSADEQAESESPKAEQEKQAQEEGASAKSGDEEKADEKKADDEKAAEGPKTAKIGERAPTFTLTSAAGKKHELSDYEGKIVVLEWTNTECPYVKRHHKAKTMQKTHEKLGGGETPVEWIAIDSSHFAKAKTWKKWRGEYGIEYPVLLDPSGEVGKKYEAKTTPHMYVIDTEGVLRYRGAIDDSPMGEKDDPTNYVTKAVQALKNGEKIEKSSTEPYGCSVKYGG